MTIRYCKLPLGLLLAVELALHSITASTASAADPLPDGVIAQLGSSCFRAAGQLHFVRLSPDGRVLATRSAVNLLRLSDVESGRLVRQFQLRGGMRGDPLGDAYCVWSPDGKHLALVESQTHVRLLDGRTLEDQLTLDEKIVDPAVAVRFEADGRTLIVGRRETAAAFDVATGKFLRELPLGDEPNRELHPFLADPKRPGRVIRTKYVSADSTIINTFNDEQFVQILTGGPKISGIGISGDLRRIVAGDRDGNVALWNPHTKTRVTTWPALRSQVDFVSLSQDGSVVATGSASAEIGRDRAGDHVRIWKLSGDERKEIMVQEWLPDDSHNSLIASLCYDDDGKHLVSTSTDDEVGIWNVAERRRVARLPKGYAASASHRGDLLATHGLNDSSQVKLFDLADPAKPQLQHTFVGTARTALSHDGRRLATMKPQSSRLVCIWDTETKELVRELEARTPTAYQLVWSPDDKWLACGGHGVRVWDVETGRRALDSDTASPHRLGFTADSRYLLTARGSGGFKSPPIMLWDHIEGVLVREFGTTERVMSFAAPSNPQRMLTGCADGTIRLWDVTKGTLLKTVPAHPTAVYALALSPDEKQFASGAADSTIFLWDAAILAPDKK